MAKSITSAQQRVFDMLDSEPLTPTNVSTALNVSIYTAREHLKALVASGHIEATRRGRVIYYHQKGIDVPTGEDIVLEEIATGDDASRSDGGETEHELEGHDASWEEGGDGSMSAIMEGYSRKRTTSKNDDWIVDGAVDLKRVVPKYDPDTANNEELAKLRKDTPSSALPLVSEALTCMISLQGDQPGLRDLYAKYEARDIERGLLIRWFLAMKAHGVDPSLIVRMKAKNVIRDDFHERAILKEEEDALFHRSLSVEEWKLRRH